VQIPNNTPIDPAVASASIDNQIDIAVARRALQAQKQEGEAAVALVQGAVDISQQIASGHIDVRL
jgi:hypothetical protein